MSQFDREAFIAGKLNELAQVASEVLPKPSAEENLKSPLDVSSLRDRLRRLQTNPQNISFTEQIKSLTKSNERIRNQHLLLLQLVDKTFDLLSMEKRVPTEIAEEIIKLKPLISRMLLIEPESLSDPNHHSTRFFKLLISSSFAWNNSLGRAGEPYLNAVKEQCQWLSFSYLDDSGVFNTATKALERFITQHEEKARKLENRISDSAIGVIEAKKNRFIAIRQINRLLGTKEYPTPLIRFIQGPWKDSLQLARSQASNADDVSLEYARLAGTLIWSVSDDALKNKAKFYEVTETLKKQLVEKLISLPSDSAREDAIKPIKQLYLKLGQAAEIEILTPTPIPEDEIMPGVNARISPQILKRVQEIKIGQYFRVKTKDGKLRIIKLTLKSDDARLLIFTNFSGVKSLEMNYAEFSWLLSNNQAKAIQQADLYKLCWKKILSDTLEQKISPPASSNKPVAEAEPTALKASKEKAITEAEQHISTEVKKPTMPPELTVGSWIECLIDGEPKKIKLAAHIASMDRYVFVDRAGRKVLQSTHKEIENKFMAGYMTLIELGKNFDTFNQVIGQISSSVEANNE